MFAFRAAARKTALSFAVAALVASGGCAGSKDAAGTNILLVTLDTTRADYLSCYGYQGPVRATPNLDSLAADGVRFDRAISASAATPVSHATILTGVYPYRHGVRVIYAEEGYFLADSVATLASILGEKGWDTGAVLSSFTVSEFYGFDRGFRYFDSGISDDPEAAFRPKGNGLWGWEVEKNQRRSDATTDEAIRWLEGAKRPFCLWVHYWDPHDERLLPPEENQRLFETDTKDIYERKRLQYAGEIHYMDSQFGRLIRRLKESGEYDNTAIVVVADHGEGLGDHGWWNHRILYQEQIRVPLIAKIPGWPAGEEIAAAVRSADTMPTLLAAAGVAPPPGLDGRDMTPVVLGEEEEPRTAYADAINLYDLNAGMVRLRPDDSLLHSLIDGDWKLIHRPLLEGKDELYRLSSDPREETNLVEEEPDRATRLREALDRFNGYVRDSLGEAADPETLERLKALGYVGD
ncbi:MAG: sulfatase [Candidatus Eisenbacteria bacterium]|nr:sulfatase [Candidatus Eisenbacteria bacterium]